MMMFSRHVLHLSETVCMVGLFAALVGCGGQSGDTTDAIGNIPAENTKTACEDGIDNDHDGFTDCADQDCSVFIVCAKATADDSKSSGQSDAGVGPAADAAGPGESYKIAEAPPVPLGTVGPPAGLYPGCMTADERNSKGDLAAGVLKVGVRVRIAQNTNGAAAVDGQRVNNDIAVLNTAYAASGISFELLDSQLLPADNAVFTTAYGNNIPIWNQLCNGSLVSLKSDSLPIVYVGSMTGSIAGGGAPAGFGGLCGVVISASATTKPNTTAMVVMAQEAGHFLGLYHTFDCVQSAADPNNQYSNGDDVPDTPFDPGPKKSLICYDEEYGAHTVGLLGMCTQDAACNVACDDGSQPDGHNFMSYYSWDCADHFTKGQSLFVRCMLATVKVGVLIKTCSAGPTWAYCGSKCLDTSADDLNCGKCGKACLLDEHCVASKCAAKCICGSGACCSNGCSPDTSGTSCGTCKVCDGKGGCTSQPDGVACNGGSCQAGSCVDTGTCPSGCSGHGSCSNKVCKCQVNYAGLSCGSCAPGYQGYPNCAPIHICDTTCGNQAASKCYCDAACQTYGDCCAADGSMPTTKNFGCSGSTCNLCNKAIDCPTACSGKCGTVSGCACPTCGPGYTCDTAKQQCLGQTCAACDDGNVCTDDACALGTCTYTPNTSACSDGDACTVADSCSAGKCQAGAMPSCDDKNICTNDVCIKATGVCSHINNASPCDDGNSCTNGDGCTGGACVGTPTGSCNDNNPCTDDSCSGSCIYTPNSKPCNDNNSCTQVDACSGGTCKGGSQQSCDDANSCTNDSCSPSSGCQHVGNGNACNDGNACTNGDVCTSSICSGKIGSCDDGNACTSDSCNATTGCTHNVVTLSCDDGNACTSGDKCVGGTCVGSGGPNCDDNNPCTSDSCNATSGCTHSNNSLSCDDGNACTVGDKCAAGSCSGSGAQNCDDYNPCTTDNCSSASGCSHSNNSLSCDDGNACTTGDKCSGGSCTSGVTETCNYHGVCSNGSCNCNTEFDGSNCGTCAAGYGGYPNCTKIPTCPNNCSGNGNCVNGTCNCAPGYLGNDCGTAAKCYIVDDTDPDFHTGCASGNWWWTFSGSSISFAQNGSAHYTYSNGSGSQNCYGIWAFPNVPTGTYHIYARIPKTASPSKPIAPASITYNYYPAGGLTKYQTNAVDQNYDQGNWKLAMMSVAISANSDSNTPVRVSLGDGWFTYYKYTILYDAVALCAPGATLPLQ